MSFIPQITCRNCGMKFSPFLGRCPSCGTRYLKNPFRSVPTTGSASANAREEGRPVGPALELTNLQWQLVFGGILIVAVIVAVIILITASLNPAEKPPKPSPGLTPDTSESEQPVDPGYIDEPEYTPELLYTEPPIPTVAATSITITYQGEARTEFAMNPLWGDVQLGATVYPTDATGPVKWRSSDDDVCTVDETGLVHQVGTGTCQIIAECGIAAQKCTVYAQG